MSSSQSSFSGGGLSERQAMLKVITRLREAGFEALLAGGCVRDMLLGNDAHDYDVATNATPDSICKLFGNTLTVGAQFGVVVILIGGKQIEAATFRSDDSYADGRRPESVVFTDARHDAQRRDFTINGMFYDPLKQCVIDYVGGQDDLKAGIIRAIGDADARFAEDHLRMLRAIRFACRLDFEIEQGTYKAICDHAQKITKISAERITGELERILTDKSRCRAVQLALDTGLLAGFIPTLSDLKVRVGLAVLAKLPEDISFHLALAGLLVQCSSSEVGKICRRLKTSNDVRRHTVFLVEKRSELLDSLPLTKGRLKRWMTKPLFDSLLCFTAAWLRANRKSQEPLTQLREQMEALADEPIAPEPLLNGHALMNLGVPPGPMLGRLVEELYLSQLEGEVHNIEQAKQWATAWFTHHKERD